MPLFSRLKGKGANSSSKSKINSQLASDKPSPAAQKPQWDISWTSKTVQPEDVQELVRACTREMRSRGTRWLPPSMLIGTMLN